MEKSRAQRGFWAGDINLGSIGIQMTFKAMGLGETIRGGASGGGPKDEALDPLTLEVEGWKELEERPGRGDDLGRRKTRSVEP